MSLPQEVALPLADRRLLVVEDAVVIASKVSRVLGAAGADVIGPIATLGGALQAVEREASLHAALVDVDLRGEFAFPLCEKLAQRAVPFMLLTGYDPAALPRPWSDSFAIQKPFQSDDLVQAVLHLMAAPLEPSATMGEAEAAVPENQRLAAAVNASRNLIMERQILREAAEQSRHPRRTAD